MVRGLLDNGASEETEGGHSSKHGGLHAPVLLQVAQSSQQLHGTS